MNYENVIKFSSYAAAPDKPIIYSVLKDSDSIENRGFYGWKVSNRNPEDIINSFSHLRIKEGYKLRGYEYEIGGNGNGIVFALPSDRELPCPEEVFGKIEPFCLPYQLEFGSIEILKPEFAALSYMEAVEGDLTPESYLQGAIAFHQLSDFQAKWHGISWGDHIILPSDKLKNNSDIEWEMEAEEPKILEPHFYYDQMERPVIVFHTINFRDIITLNTFQHTFIDGYCLECKRVIIGTAGMGFSY